VGECALDARLGDSGQRLGGIPCRQTPSNRAHNDYDNTRLVTIITTMSVLVILSYGLAILNPVHTSNNVEATFDLVAKIGNNVERVLR